LSMERTLAWIEGLDAVPVMVIGMPLFVLAGAGLALGWRKPPTIPDTVFMAWLATCPTALLELRVATILKSSASVDETEPLPVAEPSWGRFP